MSFHVQSKQGASEALFGHFQSQIFKDVCLQNLVKCRYKLQILQVWLTSMMISSFSSFVPSSRQL